MPPAARSVGKVTTPTPPRTCAYPIRDEVCGQPATHVLPVGAASNSDPLDLCALHAGRYLGAAQAIA